VSAGFGNVTGALAGVDILRIIHNPDPTFAGPGVGIPPVNAVLGVDNITAAAAIPEPATWLLTTTAAAFLFVVRRTRR
jgi:hypothetical protein